MKISLAEPGIHAVSFEELTMNEGWGLQGVTSSELQLRHREQSIPLWIEDGNDGELGPGDRILFPVAPELFASRPPEEGAGPRVFLLSLDAERDTPGEDPSAELGNDGEPVEELDLENLEPLAVPVQRLRYLERDLIRVPLTAAEESAGLESLWYWAMITERSSSSVVVDLGPLSDLATEDGANVELTLRLLGWSESQTPDGLSQHQIAVFLNESPIANAEWNGRRRHELRADDVPAQGLAGDARLTVRVRPRTLPDADVPLVDIVYLDSVELRYRPASPLVDAEHPLVVAAANRPRWIPDPSAPADSRAFSTEGWMSHRTTRHGVAGWLLPSSPAESTLWIVDEGGLRSPLEITATHGGARSVRDDTQYLMIGPSDLLPGVEPLADFHRGRGLRVETMDVEAIYDDFGGGERSAAAIRRFLQHQHSLSGELRYVLLIGDADWLPITDPATGRVVASPGRDRVPTLTYLSEYGPAASDHYYALAEPGAATPEIAVGRLPVVTADELAATVAKILRHVGTPSPPGELTILMLSDRTEPSLGRRSRLMQRLEDLDVEWVTPSEDPGAVADLAVIEALDRDPALVYFGGHGSRLNLELGQPGRPSPETFFDIDDIARLAPADRLPIVVSASCATAPFDHPSAGSLGEAMVSSPDRGAIAYVGASAMLFTPIRFGESLVRAIRAEATLGDALVRAKRETGAPRVSFLYNLIGDPALPLR